MARKVAVDAPCGLVQVIELRWTKFARGGEAAGARAGVPEACEVPAETFAGASGMLCVETFLWSDGDLWADPSARRRRIPVGDGFAMGCVSVSSEPGGLRVRYEYNESGGAPARWCDDEVGNRVGVTHCLAVGDGKWAQVRYNARFSCVDTGQWWYQQLTVNVAWFASEPDGRIFLERKPTKRLSLIAKLR